MTFNPAETIVPVLGLSTDGKVERFLGTGAFVGDGSLLVTADHVIRDWRGTLAMVLMRDLTRWMRLDVVGRDPSHDLALLRVTGYTAPRPLALAFDMPIHTNFELMTFEYGTTVVAGGRIVLEPATRLGHMTRMRNMTEQLGPAGDAALELSWPALRGASGAPVVSNDGHYRIVGVIVANAEYHLLPVQIESVLDERNGLIEERRYMMPQAIAVNVRHLQAMFERHSTA